MSEFDGVVVEGQEGVVAPQGDATPQGQTPVNPLEPGGVRFEQIYGKMKDYEKANSQWKEFGDPASVKEKLTKFEQYEKALKEYREKQAQTPQEQQDAQRAAQIRKELEKVYPEIVDVKSLKELKETLNEIKNQASMARAEQVLERASHKFTDILKTAGIDVKHQSKIEEYIVSQMSDEERRDFSSTGDVAIADRIFQNELKDGLFAGMRSKKMPPAPPVRNTAGGTPPTSKDNKPKTLEEAAAVSFSMLSNRE